MESINTARSIYSNYLPLTQFLVLRGNANIRVVQPSTKSVKMIEEFYIPEDFTFEKQFTDIVRYVKKFKGIDTTDVIVYDFSDNTYLRKRNLINNSELEKLNLVHFINNEKALHEKLNDDKYIGFHKYITKINNRLTCIMTADIVEDNVYTVEVYDLNTNEDITNKIDLFNDIW